MKNYYSLLGLEQSATKAEIKKNYRLLAAKFHPDKNDDPEAATKFIAITEAYDVLSSKKRRTQYDLFRWQQLKREQATEESYEMVVPPRETTRTRRNKAQQNRSLKYHQAAALISKRYMLLAEGFHIVFRYALHILGLTLLFLILYSVTGEILPAFHRGLLHGLFICMIISGIIYAIVLICNNAVIELNKDIKAFSVFYRTSQKKAALISLSVFTLVMFIYVTVLILKNLSVNS